MRHLLSAGLLLAVAGNAGAVALELLADNTRTDSGTLVYQAFKPCDGAQPAPTGCLNPGNPWVLANGVTGSTATWSWDGTTLAAAGTFWTTAFVSSSPNGTAILSETIGDLVIDTANLTTAATRYACIEGNFLATVGLHGCSNTLTGANAAYDSVVTYNVGNDARCVQRVIGGDDASNGNPRGLLTAPAAGPCDAVDGAWGLWTIVEDGTGTGGHLVLSNGIPVGDPGTHYMTFTVVPAPATGGLLGAALAAALGWSRRRYSTRRAGTYS